MITPLTTVFSDVTGNTLHECLSRVSKSRFLLVLNCFADPWQRKDQKLRKSKMKTGDSTQAQKIVVIRALKRPELSRPAVVLNRDLKQVVKEKLRLTFFK